MKKIIRNGLIYDGTGREPFSGDVLVEDDKIVSVGRNLPKVDGEEIDASGLWVTPGFFDSHRHSDFAIFNDSDFGLSELSQGITTILIGPCGMSAYPYSSEWYSFIEPCLGKDSGIRTTSMAGYLSAIREKGIPLNVGAMIGMGSVKSFVKGFSAKPWNDQDFSRAVALLDEAIDAGAFAISSGIMYTPECYFTTADYIKLLSMVKDESIPFVTHMRGEGDSLLDAVAEVLEISLKSGHPLNISHFKSVGKENWNRKIKEAIKLIGQAKKPVSVDFYPYTGGATTLMTLLPPACCKESVFQTLQFLFTKEGNDCFRKEIVKKHPNWDNMVESIGWERIILSSVENDGNRKYLGMDFEAIGQMMKGDASDAFLNIMKSEEGRAGIIVMSMLQSDVDEVARLPYSSVISDSLYGSLEFPHPRLNGAFPRALRDLANDRSILTVESVINKMTGKPASFYGLEERGLIREGYYADLNLINPKTLKDNADFLNPKKQASGMETVFVNGIVAFQNGNIKNRRSGIVLKRQEVKK